MDPDHPRQLIRGEPAPSDVVVTVDCALLRQDPLKETSAPLELMPDERCPQDRTMLQVLAEPLRGTIPVVVPDAVRRNMHEADPQGSARLRQPMGQDGVHEDRLR